MPTEQPNENYSRNYVALNENTPIKEPKAETSKEALTPEELRRQKRREYMREYCREYYRRHKEEVDAINRKSYWRNRDKRLEKDHKNYQKNREKNCAKHREYRRSAHYREIKEKYDEKLREEYQRFKIEYGGKCSVCGEDNLIVLEPHHPEERREKDRRFIYTKEFRDWLKYGIKPRVILLCANHHLELEIGIKQKKIPRNIADPALIAQFLKALETQGQ